VPAFVRACRQQIAALSAPLQVVSGFGAAAAPGSVVWMQSVHAAWMETSRRTRGPLGRLKQRLNPFHPIILHLERKLLAGRRYRKIIALTEQVRDDVEKFYGVQREDIVVIPNGFSPQEFSLAGVAKMRAPIRARLGYAEGAKVVIFVANELERKGFRPLLRAIARLGDPTVHLLAVGRLSASACESEICALGLSGRVKFTGATSEVADYFAAAEVFALPTQYEAWGLVVTEAMACGLPVLTSRLAGAAVTVQEPASGRLLDDPDDDAEIAQKLGALLRGEHAAAPEIAQAVSHYRWSELLTKYEEVLLAHSL
jgi:UDP-glucose:(heptosyl)LPS alpha-1,3-glucosyltransferase